MILPLAATSLKNVRFLQQQNNGLFRSGEGEQNEISEFDCDLVPDPVFSFLWIVGAGHGYPGYHPGIACPWRCHIYIDWPLNLRAYSLLLGRLYLFNRDLPSSWQWPAHIPSRYGPRSPTRQTGWSAPMPTRGCGPVRTPGACAGCQSAAW